MRPFRPLRPLYRYCSAAILSLLFAAMAASAAVEHRAKTDGTLLYRTRLLEPPPLATLAEGDEVDLMVRGRNESMVKTEGGLRGWVRNADLVEVKVADSRHHRIREQGVIADGLNISPFVLDQEDWKVKVDELDRSFANEVVETVDREQLEMRNDEN